MTIRRPLHESLRAERERLGLSLRDVAERFGVAPATVCRWETGKRALRGAARLLVRRWVYRRKHS